MNPRADSRLLHDELEQAVHAKRTRLCALPFLRLLSQGEVEAGTACLLLDAMERLYGALAESLPDEPRLRSARALVRTRLDSLAGILADLPTVSRPVAPVVTVRVQLLAHHLRTAATESAIAGSAAAWTLDTSPLTSAVFGQPLARTLGLEGEIPRWEPAGSDRGSAELDPLSCGPGPSSTDEDRTSGRSAAVLTAGHLTRIASALHPLESLPVGGIVRELNPEAGHHPVTMDEPKLEAAIRAGERSWNAFSYYRERYGDRGRAFTRSDSAWLVTLCRQDRASAHQDILWLANLLASRGMPRWLMESHLYILHAELARTIPEGARNDTRYANLLSAAEMLRAMRECRIAPEAFTQIEEQFCQIAPPDELSRVPRAGAILAAALSDDFDGVVGALASVLPWFRNRTRFSASWIDAVDQVVESARGRVSDSASSLARRARPGIPTRDS